jgi:hypothetical protein
MRSLVEMRQSTTLHGSYIKEGVRCAEAWLEGSSLLLWWVLSQNRKRHRRGDPQEAFEAGFAAVAADADHAM